MNTSWQFTRLQLSSYYKTFIKLLPARNHTFAVKAVFVSSMQYYRQVRVITGHKNDFLIVALKKSVHAVVQSRDTHDARIL